MWDTLRDEYISGLCDNIVNAIYQYVYHSFKKKNYNLQIIIFFVSFF